MIVELIGGPRDGFRCAVPDDGDIIVKSVTVPDKFYKGPTVLRQHTYTCTGTTTKGGCLRFMYCGAVEVDGDV